MAKVTTRKKGSTWYYRFEAAKVNGKRQQVEHGGFRTKAEAEAAGAKAQNEYNQTGLHFVPSEISVADYLDYWMEHYCRVNLKSSSIAGYEKKIRLYIKPKIGNYKLKALTPAALQELINDRFNEGISRATLANIKGILSASLRYAVEPLHFIQTSPMIYVNLPSTRAIPKNPPKTKPHIYLKQEWINKIFQRFPEGASTHIPMMFGYKGGMRLGEAFAVDWTSVDFENNTIDINKQVQWDAKKRQWFLGPPKYNSYRVIKVDSGLMALLKREKERQDKAREYYGEFYTNYFEDEHRYLNTEGIGTPVFFVNVRENGTFITPRTMLHAAEVIHYHLGVKGFDFHSFRYTHATMLAERQAPIKYVQKRLGHKNIQVTLEIYQQVSDTIREQGDDLLDQLYR